MNHFKFISQEFLAAQVSVREGETKLGEHVVCIRENDWSALASSAARFVIIGIPEDIGVKANYGTGGTPTLWEPALKAILNVQDADKLQGADMVVLGYFDFSEWRTALEGKPIEAWREKVEDIDIEVAAVIEKIIACDKIPLVIGGGHNNAYPIIKGISRAKNESINCINIDAHSDYRRLEGRHSGNGFRYAKMNGYLHRYVALGLDENYNSRNVLAEMDADADISYHTFEAIFLHEKMSFKEALSQSAAFLQRRLCGIEVDMDRIAGALSSAASPCGVSPVQVRQFVSYMAQNTDAAYLHIAEGAMMLDDGREDMLTAKMVAYLATDFMKAVKNTVYKKN